MRTETTAGTTAGPTDRSVRRDARQRPLVAGLCAVVLSIGLVQTGVVPVLGVIADQLGVSPRGVSWVVTANLLAAVAATPLIGRLADLRCKKRVLLATLALVLAGCVLAASTSSLPVLIVSRILQGTCFALYPVAVAVLRDELSGARLRRATAMLSAMVGVGVGLGLVTTGLLVTDGASYHRVFWMAAMFTGAVTLMAFVAVPSRPVRRGGRVDWGGAALGAAGLSALLLAITQVRSWGWFSPLTTLTTVVGLAVLTVWWRRNRRHPHPFIPAAALSERRVFLANVVTLLAGAGLYFSLLGITDRVEAPSATGYGLGATVLRAGTEFLLPGALAGVVTALLAGRCIERLGTRTVMVCAGVCGIVGFAMLAELHSAPWHAIAAAVLTNAYISLAYAGSPSLMAGAEDPRDVGALTSLNTIVRPLGAAVAAAAVTALVSSAPGGFGSPAALTAVYILGALSAAAMVPLVLAVPTARHS